MLSRQKRRAKPEAPVDTVPLAWPAHALQPVGLQPGSGLVRTVPAATKREEVDMLWTIFVILVVAWLLGMVSSYTFGGFLHLLLVLAVAVVLINIIQGRRPV